MTLKKNKNNSKDDCYVLIEPGFNIFSASIAMLIKMIERIGEGHVFLFAIQGEYRFYWNGIKWKGNVKTPEQFKNIWDNDEYIKTIDNILNLLSCFLGNKINELSDKEMRDIYSEKHNELIDWYINE